MSENTVKVKIKQRCDTEANWKASDPVLLDGEMAISSDKDNRYKIGNGTSKWSALSYAKAEPTTHTHTKSQITDFPAALKNPTALTISLNGTSQGAYDGSAAKSINITPASIGAIATTASCNKNWNWSGKSGQPTWLWGGEEPSNMYVYNPSNFNVNGARYIMNINGKMAATVVMEASSTTSGQFRIATADGLSTVNFTLGGTGTTNRWKQVYATATTISTSDRNQKHSIQELSDRYEQLFLKLLPVSFLYNNGESGRTHIGFISQDVETAMKEVGLTDLDFAGFCRDIETDTMIDENGNDIDIPRYDENGNPVYIYSLRYEEFVALNTHMLQKLYNKVDDLESRLASLESMK